MFYKGITAQAGSEIKMEEFHTDIATYIPPNFFPTITEFHTDVSTYIPYQLFPTITEFHTDVATSDIAYIENWHIDVAVLPPTYPNITEWHTELGFEFPN